MSIIVPARSDSTLDHRPLRFSNRPVDAETLSLLESVRDHDGMSSECVRNDDSGIASAEPTGRAQSIRRTTERRQWFRKLHVVTEGDRRS